ncbi:MAG: rhomboid family intramembrane serine protease [Sandaracinaceae bacterium]
MQFQFPKLTPAVRALLIVLGVMFVGTAVVQNVFQLPAFDWLALNVRYMVPDAGAVMSPGAPTPGLFGLIWQPLTYWMVWPPIPQSFLNAALSLFFLYLFNSPFEEKYGAARMLQMSAAGILSAAIGSVAVAAILPGGIPVYGAGVIVSATIGGFPVLFKERNLFLIPFPFAIRPWTFVLVAVGIAAVNAVLAQDLYIFLSDVFAMLGGYAFATWMDRSDAKKAQKPKKRRNGPALRVLEGGGQGSDDEPPRYLN